MRRMRPRALTPDEAADLAAGLDEPEVDERIEAICLAPVVEDTATLSEAAHNADSRRRVPPRGCLVSRRAP